MKITYRRVAIPPEPQQITAHMKPPSTYERLSYRWKLRRLLPHIQYARSLGLHRLNDILEVVRQEFLKECPGKPLTRITLYRALIRLRQLGLDPGPDDRSTARGLGRPKRGKKSGTGNPSGTDTELTGDDPPDASS